LNILFLGSISLKRNRLDGVTVKSRCLKNWLDNKEGIKLKVIDTDNWTKNIIKICSEFINNIYKSDVIVISSAQRGANVLIKLLKIIRCKKDVYYFVAGGRLGKYMLSGIYNKKDYYFLKRIYVESDKIVKELHDCGLKNTIKILNFREFNIEDSFKLNTNVNLMNNINFVFYSRVIKEKGIEDLIFAFNELKKKYRNIYLDIYGQVDDNYLEYLNTIKEEGVKYKGVIIPNNRDEYKILSEYDIFVLPTYYKGECLPGALIDAYISGLAIIASNWEYAQEYIADGTVGYIHKYKDLNDLMNKMEMLILNNDMIIKFKENSQKESIKFKVDNALEDFNKCLFNIN